MISGVMMRCCESPVNAPSPPSRKRSRESSKEEAGAEVVDVDSPPTHTPEARTLGNPVGPLDDPIPPPPPAPSMGSERRLRQSTLVSFGLLHDAGVVRKEMADRDAQIDELRDRCAAAEAKLTAAEASLSVSAQQLASAEQMAAHCRRVLRAEMLRAAKQSRRDARRALHARHFELGQIATWQMSGREVWVEGDAPIAVLQQLEDVAARREEVEERKKAAEKRWRQLMRGGEEDSSAPELQAALMEQQEALQLCAAEYAALGATMHALKQRQMDLDLEKKAFLKEIRRIGDEDASEFLAVPAIGQEERYVLVHLLGKGGFSEVWKAFDVHEARYVACKIHRVQREWSAQTRQHYRRHADRELTIMRMLHHPHLTRLYDEFEHSEHMFVSVMEYSMGTDLDTHLKRFATLREADARLVLLQIVSALRYLAAQETPIIHYDLKPANILFHSSDPNSLEIKITDFGLSKLLQRRDGAPEDPTIELTSQGTGTYWYLPPECFDTAATPRISNKVDVWSCGVIFYQMLFGRRPFAEGESQRRIWQDKLILSSARTLRFPDTPRVSQEAKDLMQRCLEYHPSERYDVAQLGQDPYLQRPTRRQGRAERASLPPALSTTQTMPNTPIPNALPEAKVESP